VSALKAGQAVVCQRESFLAGRDDRFSFDALEDLDTVVEVLEQVALKDGSEPLALDQDVGWRLEDARMSGSTTATICSVSEFPFRTDLPRPGPHVSYFPVLPGFRSTHGEVSPTPNWIVGSNAAGGNNTPNPAATPPRTASSLSGMK
jgi:hypothetical protein